MRLNGILIFFISVLAGHIVGSYLQQQYNSVYYKGGRSYVIDFKKETDPEKVRSDLRSVFNGEPAVVKETGYKSKLQITTSFMISRAEPETDSLVLAKLLTGLRNYLPAGVTYGEFFATYLFSSYKIQPSLNDKRPVWVKDILFPFLVYGCKSLLMIFLAAYLFFSVRNVSDKLYKLVFLALLFSWFGDVLLMFQEKDSLFFMLGLSAFLLAHIFYIISFQNIRVKEGVRFRPILLAIVAVYYAVLIYILYTRLGEMRMPVMVYGVVISAMFMLALHMLQLKNRQAGQWMMLGALLFVISDSVLAINKFYQPFEQAGTIIMITYGLAQLLIVKGAVKYISGRK